jgi:hypothetical protein
MFTVVDAILIVAPNVVVILFRSVARLRNSAATASWPKPHETKRFGVTM